MIGDWSRGLRDCDPTPEVGGREGGSGVLKRELENVPINSRKVHKIIHESREDQRATCRLEKDEDQYVSGDSEDSHRNIRGFATSFSAIFPQQDPSWTRRVAASHA